MDKLKEAREALAGAVQRMHDAGDAIDAADESADLEELSGTFDEADAEVTRCKANVERLERVAKAREDNPLIEAVVDEDEERGGTGGDKRVRVVKEPLTYERKGFGRDGKPVSYFRDLAYASGKLSGGGNAGFRQRLERHVEEMTVEYEERAINSTDGSGGEFVAPLWMMEEFLALARAGRPFADAVNQKPLPPNTDSINLPRVSAGAATATQADAGAVQSTDATTGSLSIPVITVAGQQDMSRQLFDRSVPGMDEIILADLAADYATKLDVQCISGSGSGSQAKGTLNATGINAVTYTDASPTLGELYSKIADAVQRIHTGRFLPPSGIFMHPSRWGWCLAALDGNLRPLITPYAPMNAEGVPSAPASQGPVGSMHGLPVYTDASIPVNLGAGTNEDRIIVARLADIYLFEDGEPNQATYFEVLSNNLQVRVQVWGYAAFSAERYAKAVSVISGTGLVTPTF